MASRPLGEASRLFDIFTARLGRVTALAAGVRELKSKLHYHLQELAAVRVSLVRGRGLWRIVHAESFCFPLALSMLGPERRVVAARLLGLLSRLVVDEGRRGRVWREASDACRFLSHELLTASELANFELLAVWRLLATLGYCETSLILVPFAVAPWRRTLVLAFEPHRQLALPIVEQALYHSHL